MRFWLLLRCIIGLRALAYVSQFTLKNQQFLAAPYSQNRFWDLAQLMKKAELSRKQSRLQFSGY